MAIFAAVAHIVDHLAQTSRVAGHLESDIKSLPACQAAPAPRATLPPFLMFTASVAPNLPGEVEPVVH